ncbi:MAG: hypothetical protein KAI47_08085, partial [Deltaproteobacteria bacterium]|nr:hypothetical protein [Deltaproteobacteria bacterium]
MMTRRFPSLRIPALGIALALIVAGCGVDESTTDPSVESIESQLQSPNDTYTMDDEAIPDALQLAFGALDETQVTALNKALADINPGENDDALAETAAPTPNPSTAPDPGTAPDPNAKPPIKHPACPHGFIKGQWKHIAKSFGIFRGAFVDDHGKLIGWIRGVYGQNKLVGKVTAKGGKAHALLTGVYHAGHFQARLRDRAGVIGALRGHYGKNVFAGKWIRFCRPPAIVCPPHLVPHPSGLFCVPLACAPKTCPQGMFCDLCPVICKPLPKLPTGAEPALCGTQAGLVCPQGLRCER